MCCIMYVDVCYLCLSKVYDSTYMMTPDGMLYDPKTQEAVGALDPETHELRTYESIDIRRCIHMYTSV